MIDRKNKSDIDRAREVMFNREAPTFTCNSIPVGNQLHIVNSFSEVSPLHTTDANESLPAVNFQFLSSTNSVEMKGIIDRGKKIGFLLIFINWPGNEENLQNAFKEIIKQKVPLGQNNQNQNIEINTHSIRKGDFQKKMLILDSITESTSGIFIFDFDTGIEGHSKRLEKIGDFALDVDFNISDLRKKVQEVKGKEKVILGLFSNLVQSKVVTNEFLLRNFITLDDNCFSTLILPASYFPGEFNMYFELAGVIQSIINFLTTTQDYRKGIIDAQNEIFLRCIENKLPQNEATAIACSIYFGLESHNILSNNKITVTPTSEDLPSTGIHDIDGAIENVEKFAFDECQKIEKQINHAVYSSLRSINILSNQLNDYHKLLFSVVVGAQSSIWENPQARKKLKNEDRIKEMWKSFCSGTAQSLIGKQTYGENTTEGQILYAFGKSIKQIQQNRGKGSSLIYQIITEGQDDVEDPLDTLERLKLNMKSSEHNFGAAVKPQIHPINLILDEQILKYLHVLYLKCKSITHTPEILKQAPVGDEFEFLFVSSKEKNHINKSDLKTILTNLKDAVQVYYPGGLSYTTSTPMFRETSLQWWVGD